MVAFLAASLCIGLVSSRKASQGYEEYFLSGRNMPWWLLGVSIVATTFSTDTPNLVTDLVRSEGVVGNWRWWAFLTTGMLTVFLYAKLWRRSNVMTDIELYELRYSGKPAAFLRGFRAIYLGVFFNIMIMAAVTLAAIKIGGVMLGWSPLETVVIAAVITVVYSALGGLTGVLLTDLFQFVIAMSGSIAAAWYVLGLPEVGGLSALLAHEAVQTKLAFLPSLEHMTWRELVPIFVIPLAVQSWAAYYPGAEPGGGSYVVQRMLSAKNERHAVGATLAFNAMHYALRPWPWIVVALASLVVFPTLESIQSRFPHVDPQIVRHDLAYPAMLTFLPHGLLGLVVTSLAAAYMSTMSSQVNWGSSIVVNDVYRRFIRPDAGEKRLVWVGRVSTVVLMSVSCALALALENAVQMFDILLQVGAGTGLLLLLRWFWWRINAASEIAAMIASFAVALTFFVAERTGMLELDAWVKLTVGVATTTLAWILTAILTKPTDSGVLRRFYRTIRPGGPGWQRVIADARAEGEELEAEGDARSDLRFALVASALGATAIYFTLFATGLLLYGAIAKGIACAAIAVASTGGLVAVWKRLRFS